MTVVLARRKCTAATLHDGVEWLATYIPIPLWFHDILYSAKVSREKFSRVDYDSRNIPREILY